MIALRAASADDCERVYRWNFAPDVRAVSNDPRAITYEQHIAWYARRLASDAPIWIVEDGGIPVGVLRIESFRISIALGPDARGRGIGRQAIAAACAVWARPVVAEIRADNAASRACFEACGFVSRDPSRNPLIYEWSP